jgi:hypothetical protein
MDETFITGMHEPNKTTNTRKIMAEMKFFMSFTRLFHLLYLIEPTARKITRRYQSGCIFLVRIVSQKIPLSFQGQTPLFFDYPFLFNGHGFDTQVFLGGS